MMNKVTSVVSQYGFRSEVAKLCPECGHMPHMLVETGEDEGQFGAFRVECGKCFRTAPQVIFFKYDTEGNLVKVNPYARDEAEAMWNITGDMNRELHYIFKDEATALAYAAEEQGPPPPSGLMSH